MINRNNQNYRKFKNMVHKRDKYCQCCGKQHTEENPLVVHHLNGYSWDIKGREDENNGILLCKNCHTLYHKMVGTNYENNVINFIIFIREYSDRLGKFKVIKKEDTDFIFKNNKEQGYLEKIRYLKSEINKQNTKIKYLCKSNAKLCYELKQLKLSKNSLEDNIFYKLKNNKMEGVYE